jgi:hypothetical protein
VECRETLKLRFSEPVLRRELRSRISCEPQWRYSLDPRDGESVTELRLIGEERFLYDRRYSLRLARGIPDLQGNGTPEEIVYHFRSNGAGSSPPRVCGLRFYNGEDFASLAAYDTLELHPFDSGGYAFFDLSFQLADGATLPLQAAIDHFTITVSNAAAQIHPVRFETGPFEAEAPQPPAAAGQTVLRIHVWIKNRAGTGGTITLGLDSAFADSHGNPLSGDWKLSLNT